MGKGNKIEKKNNGADSLWKRIGKDISGWRKDISSTIKYNPNSEEYVSFSCTSKKERDEYLNNPEFLDENNFRLQIGKMKKKGKKGWTIYNDITLGIGIEYMIKHTKKGHQSIIQIWSDVGEYLNSGQKDWIMSADEQKIYIEDFIQKKFGKRGEAIKVEIGSQKEKYKDVFDAIKEGKDGIIPNEEPKLENIEIPGTSPLPIIKYLAYHANKDVKDNIPDKKDSQRRNLMNLFYRTKPSNYRDNDEKLGRKPGDSDADFYGIVEVGLRLFEILNGISIQGGLGRQRVYDKIISVIVNGKDYIDSKAEFDCEEDRIIIQKYPALEELCRKIGPKHYKFNQIYINLNRDETEYVEEKLNKKSKLISKLENWGYGALIAATLSGATGYFASKATKQEYQQKQERFEQERRDMRAHYNKTRNLDLSLGGYMEAEGHSRYFEEQANILMAEYDISAFNHESFKDDDYIIRNNDIVDMYKEAFDLRENDVRQNRSLAGKNVINIDSLSNEERNRLLGLLTAEDFLKFYGGQIIDKCHFLQLKPYEHFKHYKNEIENTLKYGNKIDISKCKKIKEIPTKSELGYFIKGEPGEYDNHHRKFYRLKIFRVYLDNGKTIDLIVAKQDPRRRMLKKGGDNPQEGYNIEDGYRCMQDLKKNYSYIFNNPENADSN